jgi:hypothetical protein
MKTISVLTLMLLCAIHSFGEEVIPQHKIDQAYEKFGSNPIDPEELRKVELLSSSDIYQQLLIMDIPPSDRQIMLLNVMKKRPKELALEIRKTLSEPSLSMDTMGIISRMSALVSTEFEAEIAEKILKHPSSREFDAYFMDSKDFRNHFRSEPELLRTVINILLSEQRILKDSTQHKKWEESIENFEQLKKRREGNRESEIKSGSIQSEQHDRNQNKRDDLDDKNGVSFYMLLSVGFLVLLAVLLIIFKIGRKS